MSEYPTLTPRVIGETEKTLNAFLGRLLAGTGVTEPQWVILSVAVAGGGSVTPQQAAFALKLTEPQAQDQLEQLTAAGYLTDGTSVTPRARDLFSRTRAATREITERLWGDLPAEDLATAGRVLSIITERANAELARG
jgi:DNA-binding MarR family transcriptional regulator